MCVCLRAFPVVLFDWESSDLAEAANVAQFTWPCPQPRPSPFYLSGRPASATPSSAPATRNTAPERTKGMDLETLLSYPIPDILKEGEAFGQTDPGS